MERRTAETAVVSTVHRPFGSPAGPGLFRVRGLQLPAYIQNVAHAFTREGASESEAIERAIGVVRDWAEGRTPNGKGHVHPDVQAAAARAIAEWDAARAAAHGSSGRSASVAYEYRDDMSTADINDLPDSAFAHIEPGGTKDSSGKTVPRSLRHFPIHDAAHVRNALSRASQSPFGDAAMPAIKAAAAKFGVGQDGGDGGDARSYEWLPLTTGAKPEMRGLDEHGHHRIGGYAAVFGKLSRPLTQGLPGTPPVFVEAVEPGAFNQSRSLGWPGVVCRFNHKDDELLGSVTGKTLEVSVDHVGLDYVVTPPESRKYVVEYVERGDCGASSFMFNCPPGGDSWDLTDQQFPLRRLHDVQLIDVGPVFRPAYPDATAGLRSLAVHFGADLDEVRSMADAGELRRFFVRTDRPAYVPAKPKISPAAARMRLMEKRFPKAGMRP